MKKKGSAENKRFPQAVVKSLRYLRKLRGNLPGLMERRSTRGRLARWWRRNRDPTDSNFVNSYLTTMLESWAESRSPTPKPPFLLRNVSPPFTLAV